MTTDITFKLVFKNYEIFSRLPFKIEYAYNVCRYSITNIITKNKISRK